MDCSTATSVLVYTGTLTYCAAKCSMIASWASFSTMYVKNSVCYDSCAQLSFLVGTETFCGPTCMDIGTQSSTTVYIQAGACQSTCSGKSLVVSSELYCG